MTQSSPLGYVESVTQYSFWWQSNGRVVASQIRDATDGEMHQYFIYFSEREKYFE